jgi:hypothetical protein
MLAFPSSLAAKPLIILKALKFFNICVVFTVFSFGDPHIDTLDGLQYTFNGWGEYTMIKSYIENLPGEKRGEANIYTHRKAIKIKF